MPSLPFTREDFLRAASTVDELPENLPQERDRPRASGIAGCSREIAYAMANTPKSDLNIDDELKSDLVITTAEGRLIEDFSVAVMEEMGQPVVDRQVALPDDFYVTGHPDGRLANGIEGLTTGWEHKRLGRYGFQQTFKAGLELENPGWIAQGLCYGDALGWELDQFVVLSQDASANRGDATANRRAKNPKVRWATDPNWHPKVMLRLLDLRPLFGTVGMRVRGRAEWFTKWMRDDGAPENIKRDHDPDDFSKGKEVWRVKDGMPVSEPVPDFPCSYCEWRSKCSDDGDGDKVAPVLPFGRMG